MALAARATTVGALGTMHVIALTPSREPWQLLQDHYPLNLLHKPPKRGQVRHVTNEGAQEDDSMLVLVNSHPVVVLFYSSASHSFIKEGYALRHYIVIETLPSAYHIDAPGTKLITNRVVPKAKILIEGVRFYANLILLDTTGMDVILGMNWLAKRVISLRSPRGERVSLHLGEGGLHIYVLKVTIATDLPNIPVISEFPDVFPEELLGMPPDRAVEFYIDLVPDTTQILKRSYKMPPNELAE